MTVSEILQLTAAGFSKAEILAISKTASGKPEEKKEEVVKLEEKKEAAVPDFATALAEINKRLDALTEKKEEPEKKDNTDVLALLQAMNVNNQRYDLPPQYDVEKSLGESLDTALNGAKKGDNN